MAEPFAHVKGCKRLDVRPSLYLPGRFLCATCRRMVPDDDGRPGQEGADRREDLTQPTLLDHGLDLPSVS